MVVCAQSQALGRLNKDTFSCLPFQPSHPLRNCLHLTTVVCLGCGAVAKGAYCLLA